MKCYNLQVADNLVDKIVFFSVEYECISDTLVLKNIEC